MTALMLAAGSVREGGHPAATVGALLDARASVWIASEGGCTALGLGECRRFCLARIANVASRRPLRARSRPA